MSTNAVTTERINRAKTALAELGFDVEDMRLQVSDGVLELVARIYQEDVALPEELEPYAPSDDNLERMMYKGNVDKQTWHGARFEYALSGYATAILNADPEAKELEKTLDSVNSMEELEAYQAKRQAIWERICADPKIAAWEKDLNENYF